MIDSFYSLDGHLDRFLQGSEAALFRVIMADNPEMALLSQQVCYNDIVLINLAKTQEPERFQGLFKDCIHKPKEYILINYSDKYESFAREMEAVAFKGDIYRPEGLEELKALLINLCRKHNLIKE